MAPTAGSGYVVDAVVAHRRSKPWDYAFTHRTTSWLVDAADPDAPFPRWLRPVMRIRTEDHLGGDHSPVLDKVRRTLAELGQTWTADRVLMLANARTLGHVFDPLTTYFCFADDGAFEGVLAEVHNTYGGQHCYALPADRSRSAAGGGPDEEVRLRSEVDKEFYVSPFFTVDGRYDITARLTPERVSVAISLTQNGERVFTGSVRGDLAPATPRAALRAFLRRPLASQRVSALIHFHGIRLWLRRLPVIPRSTERPRTLRRAA